MPHSSCDKTYRVPEWFPIEPMNMSVFTGNRCEFLIYPLIEVMVGVTA